VVPRDLAGAATEQRIADYLEPWTVPRVRRSWLAVAGAATSRHTLDLVPALRRSTIPKLLVWGEDDLFEKVASSRRRSFAQREIGGAAGLSQVRVCA